MNSPTPARGMRLPRLAAGAGLVALALVAPLSACGSSSSTTNAASSAATHATPTTTDSASPMDTGSPSNMGSATPDATGSTMPSDSASTPEPGASASMDMTPITFTGKRDATVPKVLVTIPTVKFDTVKFPKTLGGLPAVNKVSGEDDERFIGYANPAKPLVISVSLTKSDGDEEANSHARNYKEATSHDGGRIVCGWLPTGNDTECLAHIAGNDALMVSTPKKFSQDALVKYEVELLNDQR